MQASYRRLVTLGALVLASGLCIALLAVRERHPYGGELRFLSWNLFLAWIPFLLALALYDADHRGRGAALLVPVGLAWLLFLPNAPYMVTDFVHVGRVGGAPLWYDAGMIAAFAVTGLVLGLASVLLVQAVAQRRFGALVGWVLLLPIFVLCSAGIYLGRVHRLNSWDAVTRPRSLADTLWPRLLDPLGRPETIVAMVGFTAMLAVSYLVLYALTDLRLDERPRKRR